MKENQTPFFSIITICLNAGNALKQTVDSVLMQNFQNFEIIIKDGCSIDDSIVNLSKDNKIKLYINDDKGIYDAMNQSLHHVNGRYLVFLNAGDVFLDKYVLEKMHNIITQNKDIGLFYCDYITTNLGKRVSSPNKINNFTLFRNMLCHQCCFFEVKKFKKTGNFDLTYKVVADYDFLLRFIIKNENSYFHANLLGIKYLSGGFSYNSKQLLSKEVTLVRKNHYGMKYYFYLFILNLTLPFLRRKIYYSKNKFIQKLLLSISNFANKHM